MKTTTWLVSRGSTVLLRVAGCNEDDMFLLIYDDLLFIMKINLNSFKLLIVVISGGSLFHNFADLPIQLSSYLVINSRRSGIVEKFDFTLNIEESPQNRFKNPEYDEEKQVIGNIINQQHSWNSSKLPPMV